jgi:MFS family permease
MRYLTALGGRLFPNPRYHGWTIVALGFLASALTSPGQSFVFALYLDPVMTDLGLTRVATSTLYAGATLLAAACLPFIGVVADRLPSGRFLGGALGLIALSMIAFAEVRSVVALGIAFFLLRLLAQGAIGLGTITATVRWFRRYRGRALALVGLGYSFGQLAYPGLVYWLIGSLGWRGSLLAMAAVYLLVAAPLVGWFTREPEERDGPIDGVAPAPAPGAEAATPAAPEPSFTLRQAAALPVFWGLLLCVAVPPLVYTAVIFHQVAIFQGTGWDVSLVPLALMVMAAASVAAAFATGLLLEIIPSRFGVGAALGLCALGLLPLLLPLEPLAGAVLYGLVFGLGSGVNASANSIIWPDYFGVAALGALKGVVTAVRNGATALGPPIAAVLAAGAGSFTSSILLFATISLLAALASLVMVPPEAAGTTRQSGDRSEVHGRRRVA